MKASELIVGRRYRVRGMTSLESTFEVMVKEELKNGNLFLLVQWFERDPRTPHHTGSVDSCTWEIYSPNQETSFESADNTPAIVLQILMFDVQKHMVVDIWESTDRKLLLRCVKNSLPVAVGKAGWNFGDHHTFTVYEVEGLKRSFDLKVAIPVGCKVPRPCIDGVDFLTWNPPA